MKKKLITAAIVGLIVGLGTGLLFNAVPTIDNIIPDSWESMIIGALAGGSAAFAAGRVKNTPAKKPEKE